MNVEQVSDILALIQTFDNRKVDEATVIAWYRVLGPYDFADAQDAVTAHFTASTAWLMPANIVRACVSASDRRRARRSPAEIRADEQAAEQLAEIRAAARGAEPRALAPVTPITGER